MFRPLPLLIFIKPHVIKLAEKLSQFLKTRVVTILEARHGLIHRFVKLK